MTNIINQIQICISQIFNWCVSILSRIAIAGLLVALGYFWGANTVLEGKPSGVAQIASLAASVSVPVANAANLATPTPALTDRLPVQTITKASAPTSKAHKLIDPTKRVQS